MRYLMQTNVLHTNVRTLYMIPVQTLYTVGCMGIKVFSKDQVFFFLNIIYLFIYLTPLSLSCGMWDLAPLPGIEPRAPCTRSVES